MINYHCPDFYRAFDIYQTLIMLKKNYPYCFYDNVNIASIFGTFPAMTWNGGSIDCLMPKIPLHMMEEIIGIYYDEQIPIKLTVTNPLLEKEDCYDRYCNAVLKLCENDQNEVLVSSPVLENYIREKYPLYKINHSILATKEDKTVEEYVDELSIYHQVVLPKRVVKNFDFLTKIPEEYRSRFELLCSDHCNDYCPRLYTHYRDYAKGQLFLADEPQKFNCSQNNGNDPFEYLNTKSNQILIHEIQKDYEPYGFSEFKLSGRQDIVKTILVLTEYFIKPEYKYDVTYLLFKALKIQ